jgi:3-hydroxyisobutyrate dehydrogenase
MGSRLKLAANHWMIAMVTALAESMHLCRLMGLEEQQFVNLLDGGPLGSSYGVGKLGEMQRHDYPAGFPVRSRSRISSWSGRLRAARASSSPCSTLSSSGSATSRTVTPMTISPLCTS